MSMSTTTRGGAIGRPLPPMKERHNEAQRGRLAHGHAHPTSRRRVTRRRSATPADVPARSPPRLAASAAHVPDPDRLSEVDPRSPRTCPPGCPPAQPPTPRTLLTGGGEQPRGPATRSAYGRPEEGRRRRSVIPRARPVLPRPAEGTRERAPHGRPRRARSRPVGDPCGPAPQRHQQLANSPRASYGKTDRRGAPVQARGPSGRRQAARGCGTRQYRC